VVENKITELQKEDAMPVKETPPECVKKKKKSRAGGLWGERIGPVEKKKLTHSCYLSK